jgi:hypothetical protein
MIRQSTSDGSNTNLKQNIAEPGPSEQAGARMGHDVIKESNSLQFVCDVKIIEYCQQGREYRRQTFVHRRTTLQDRFASTTVSVTIFDGSHLERLNTPSQDRKGIGPFRLPQLVFVKVFYSRMRRFSIASSWVVKETPNLRGNDLRNERSARV